MVINDLKATHALALEPFFFDSTWALSLSWGMNSEGPGVSQCSREMSWTL
jgi:hypothetical protein